MPAVLGLLWSQPSCRQRGSLAVLRLLLGEVALALQTTPPHTLSAWFYQLERQINAERGELSFCSLCTGPAGVCAQPVAKMSQMQWAEVCRLPVGLQHDGADVLGCDSASARRKLRGNQKQCSHVPLLPAWLEAQLRSHIPPLPVRLPLG